MRVAHHAAYLVWLEAGRVEALRARGFSFAEVEASGFGHAVREVRIQYRRPARFDQELVLRVAIVEAKGPRMTFGYRLYDAGEMDGASGDAGVGGAGGTGGSSEPKALVVAVTEMIWVTPEGYPTRLPASHPLAPVLEAQERYPEWGTW